MDIRPPAFVHSAAQQKIEWQNAYLGEFVGQGPPARQQRPANTARIRKALVCTALGIIAAIAVVPSKAPPLGTRQEPEQIKIEAAEMPQKDKGKQQEISQIEIALAPQSATTSSPAGAGLISQSEPPQFDAVQNPKIKDENLNSPLESSANRDVNATAADAVSPEPGAPRQNSDDADAARLRALGNALALIGQTADAGELFKASAAMKERPADPSNEGQQAKTAVAPIE